jgi:hypothetical protein
MTYLIAAAFHDLRIITQDLRPEVKRLATAIESLANYLIKPDSHLIQPMSNAYWETRDVVQEFPDWTCDGTIEWSPSEQDKYLQGKVA